MSIQLCEKCNNCIPATDYDDWKKWQYAKCRARVGSEAVNMHRVTGSGIPDSEKYGYCQCKRTDDACPDFIPLPYSIEAIDKHRRFDDEKGPSILDMPELEDEE